MPPKSKIISAKSTAAPSERPCLVVCHQDCTVRMQQAVLPHLDFNLEMVPVITKEELLHALQTRRPPLCILEHLVMSEGLAQDEKMLIAHGMPRAMAKKLGGRLMECVPAYQVLSELAAASPNTRFIVACHNKGYDAAKAHAADYQKHAAVIKTMGFINGLVNMRYLAKLLTHTYAGKTWVQKF